MFQKEVGKSLFDPGTSSVCSAPASSTVLLTVELEQVWSAAAGRQALRHTVRFTWHVVRSGRMVGKGCKEGQWHNNGRPTVPGVADTSRPCSPLDLVRSPAERRESTTFPKCRLPLSLPFFSAFVACSAIDLGPAPGWDMELETVRERWAL